MESRRTYLSKLTTISAAGVTGSLAGCMGDESENTMDIASSPIGLQLMIHRIMEEEGLLEKYGEPAGIEYNIQETWDSVALLAGDQVDMAVSVGAAEAAQIGPEREIELAMHGVMLTQYPGMIVREDSEYATSETGGVQESWDAIQEDQAAVGIGGWGLSMTPLAGLIHNDVFGYDFSEDGDYNILTADFASLPTLLADGELDVAQTSPFNDASSLNYNPETDEMDGFEALYWITDKMGDMGYDPLSCSIGNFLTRADFSDENHEAVTGFVSAWQEAVDIFYQDDPTEFVTDFVNEFNAEDEEEAQAMVEWTMNRNHEVLTSNVEIDEQFIENDLAALERMSEIGVVGEDWDDWITYNPVSVE